MKTYQVVVKDIKMLNILFPHNGVNPSKNILFNDANRRKVEHTMSTVIAH